MTVAIVPDLRAACPSLAHFPGDRRGVGVELKGSYWRTAVDNLRRLDADMQQNSLGESA